jgi:putative glutathione S-transferase
LVNPPCAPTPNVHKLPLCATDVVYFKTNKKFVREYPRLREYVREVYHTEGVAASVNMRHCMDHYFSSHPALNSYAIVPKGGAWWWEDKPVDR